MEFPERRNNKSRDYCCVPECDSKAYRDFTVRFYNFPREKSSFVKMTNKFGNVELVDRRLAWIQAVKITRKITKTMKVCSLHFTKEDLCIYRGTEITSRRVVRLKTISVPSCNLPQGYNIKKFKRKPLAFIANRRLKSNRETVKNFRIQQTVPHQIDDFFESEDWKLATKPDVKESSESCEIKIENIKTEVDNQFENLTAETEFLFCDNIKIEIEDPLFIEAERHALFIKTEVAS